ncbi:hypothetical protein AB0H83_14310 [Dactylosporangium sp. NPDC050688]|uniref:hypothetical protein n=1 Tax=Dactylosporangium sp. NPDC050688 TaxID=3157217 RepID=UPI0033DD5EE5
MAVAAAGDDGRPLAAAVGDGGDRLLAWDVVADVVTAVVVSDARCVAFGDTAGGPVLVTGHADGAPRS